MKILIADDDRDQLAVREMLLTQSGFEPITACDRDSALRAATAEHPACALVDLRLPDEEGGLSLIRQLKARDARLRIFVLTGGNPRQLDGRPERALVDEVIRKGSPSSALILKLKDVERSAFPDPYRPA